jgi:hypothetical protein
LLQEGKIDVAVMACDRFRSGSTHPLYRENFVIAFPPGGLRR